MWRGKGTGVRAPPPPMEGAGRTTGSASLHFSVFGQQMHQNPLTPPPCFFPYVCSPSWQWWHQDHRPSWTTGLLKTSAWDNFAAARFIACWCSQAIPLEQEVVQNLHCDTINPNNIPMLSSLPHTSGRANLFWVFANFCVLRSYAQSARFQFQ